MVDFQSKLKSMPPEERIKRIREERERKQKELEEELEEKRKELEELEQEQLQEAEKAAGLEEETLEEMEQRRQDLSALEVRVKQFQEEGAVVQTEEPIGYQSIAGAKNDLQYLLEASPTPERQQEVIDDLYQNLHSIKENFSHTQMQSELYTMQQQMQQLSKKKNLPAMEPITNFLNQIVDYQSEERR